ncbi:putative periplasmic lipoprotein [Flavobacterium selenitireducens]|uniref:hypothetical protein n=1 Tax=Flavobacterium selenitireducens TaxID=2722704 RepID=UPI00168BF82D|nr:hypothetical protein [Flavobacterium selenitireducens]MBD3583299.1 hypothetical protein [Flavobacterium selenitireducens]
MKKTVLCLVAMLTLAACASSKAKEKSRQALPKTAKLTFENYSIKKDNASPQTTLTGLFGILESTVDRVTVRFDEANKLHIDYKDKIGRPSSYGYAGKFRKRSYDYHKHNSHKGIPPFYWVTHVERLRFRLEADSTLVVQHYYNRTGMILMMAGGGSDKQEYRFKCTKN